MSDPFVGWRRLTGLVEPLAPWLLRRRVARGKEDPARLDERLGRPSAQRPDGPLVWFHGASVGESLSLLPLVERLKAARPDAGVLVTSGTTTSADLLARRLPEGAIHQYVPVDGPAASARFLDAWRPDAAVFVESELWPNLLLGAKARGAKLALLSARLSESSVRGWTRRPAAARALLGAFDLVMAQDEAAAARLTRLGARDDGRVNLKYAGEPLPADGQAFLALRRALGDRPVLLAASTHPGEEAVVLDAFARLRDRPGRPLLVIAPRHPARGAEIAEAARRGGGVCGLRSAGDAPAAGAVYVADTLGELGLWFRLARSAFVAGSLFPGPGGHNPLEPARLDCPAASGPHVDNWAEVYQDLIDARAVAVVRDAAELAALWAADLDAPASAQLRAERARDAAEARAGELDRAWTALEALLP